MLAFLLLHANEPVSWERLASGLWGEDTPVNARATVHTHISRLRKELGGPAILSTSEAGYQLHVRPGELDADRFERFVEEGRRALAAGEAEEAASTLREALELWRGEPLAGLTYESFAQAEIARLEEQRLAALETRVEADLAAGRHAALVGELRQLVADHPTRERLAGQLMLALYRSGRQTEALEAYREARRGLVAEIGVEPGPELRGLHEAILRQDASLELEPAVAELPRELDTATGATLVGRAAELGWLRERWERVQLGTGGLVAITGPRGIGKSRLAAELAHRSDANVLYAAGAGPAEPILVALDRAREATVPTLLVFDDADQARADVLGRLDDLTRVLPTTPVLALVCGEDAEALARLGVDGALSLEPLDAEAVRAIAVQYARAPEGEEVPAEWLLKASDGVPRRVHEIASQWARREEGRRVGAVAGRAATGRRELRAMETELADDLLELQAARERAEAREDASDVVVCPFKGLASFDVADAEFFFGRERLTMEMVARLAGSRLLGVVGASGSGKSSVLRAGLLAALAKGILPGSEAWALAPLRPGEHPVAALEQAKREAAPRRRVVIAADQFEETFTLCHDEAERRAFVDALVASARDPKRCAGVILAVRADFYGRCAEYPELSRLLGSNQVLVGPMRRDELRRAIELPARRADLRIEPELVDRLLADVEGEPGALPLLSTALLELWQQRDGRRLTLRAYEAAGGVQGAVARLAETAYARLEPEQRPVARSLLLRLAGEGDGTEVVRRRVPLEELDAKARSVLDVLADERLVTVNEGAAEVAHEALLREWPRLRGWLDEDVQGRRLHHHLAGAAREWDAGGRDPGELYGGTRLASALDWSGEHGDQVNPVELTFLDASEARRQRERAAGRRRIRLAFAGLVAALAAITAVAVVAVNQRQEAERQRDIAVSRDIAASAADVLTTDPSLSLSLAMRALEMATTEQAATVLRQATLDVRTLARLPAHKAGANSATFSPDGRRAVSAGADGRVVLWDLENRRRLSTLMTGGSQIYVATFSPDGKRVATAAENGTVAVTDLERHTRRAVLRVPGQAPVSVDFSPDGRRIVAAITDGTVRIAGTMSGGPPQVLRGHDGFVFGAEFSPDGQRVLSWGLDSTIRIWDTATSSSVAVLRGHGDGVTSAAFAPTGRRIVSAGYDATIRMWSAQSGAELRRFDAEYGAFVVRFSPDGRRILSGGSDGALRILDAFDERAPAVAVLRGHRAAVLDARFSPDGRRVLSASEDGTLRLWDPGVRVLFRAPVTDGSFSPDGRRVVASGEDGTIRIWSAVGGPVERRLSGGRQAASVVAMAPEGQQIASGDQAGAVRVWQLGSPSPPAVMHGHRSRVSAVAFSPDGRRIVSSGDDGRVLLWTPPRARPVVLARHRGAIYDAAFAPDGRRIVTAGKGGALVIRSTRSGERLTVLRGHHGPVFSAAFSPDGQTIVSAGADGTVRLWEPTGRALIVARGHEGPVESVAFRPDGRRIVTAGADGTVRVWSPRQREALLTLHDHGRLALTASFSSDGRRVLSAGADGTVRISPCEVCGSLGEVLALARARVERQLTPAERDRFLPAENSS